MRLFNIKDDDLVLADGVEWSDGLLTLRSPKGSGCTTYRPEDEMLKIFIKANPEHKGAKVVFV